MYPFIAAQTAVRVGKRLKEIFESALHRQPSLVVLDNLHDAMPFFSDVEEQMSGDGLLSMKKAQGVFLVPVYTCTLIRTPLVEW